MEPKLNCRKDTELKKLNRAEPGLRPAIAANHFGFFSQGPDAKGKRQDMLKDTPCTRKGDIVLFGN